MHYYRPQRLTFSQASVILSTGGGAYMAGGGMYGRGHVWQGACVAGGYVCQGACMAGGHAWRRGMRCGGDGHCSGRYSWYWNAFLYFIKCSENPTELKNKWYEDLSSTHTHIHRVRQGIRQPSSANTITEHIKCCRLSVLISDIFTRVLLPQWNSG